MPISEAVVTIGRSLDNDIVIDERTVSRRHAQLRRRYGQYVIYDLGSRGGTLVNGHPVRESPLDDGDVVTLGGVEIAHWGLIRGDTFYGGGEGEGEAAAGDVSEALAAVAERYPAARRRQSRRDAVGRVRTVVAYREDELDVLAGTHVAVVVAVAVSAHAHHRIGDRVRH